MQPHEQTQFLSAIAKFVKDQVASATAPLLERITALEGGLKVNDFAHLGDVLENAKKATAPLYEVIEEIDGRVKSLEDRPAPADGKDGSSITVADVTPMIEACLADNVKSMKDHVDEFLGGIPKPVDGKDGKDADMNALIELCKEWAVGTVAKLYEDGAIKSGEDGADGKDGKDGRDGADGKAVSLDEITALVSSAVADLPVPRHVVSGYIDRDGDLHHVLSDGTDVSFGKVVGRDGVDGKDAKGEAGKDGKDGEDGKDGVDGKDGKDGLGFKDMSVTFDGERDFVFRFVLDERIEELALTIPFMIYRGVWKAGEYKRGDTITRDGSLYVALRDTDAQPGTVESGWQLAAKRGRDGRDLEGKK